MSASRLAPAALGFAAAVLFSPTATAQTTTRVSVDSSGGQGNAYCWSGSIAAGGRYVAFYSYATNLVPGDTNHRTDVFVHDRLTARTRRVSVNSLGQQGNQQGDSTYPDISADGRFVAFYSNASNLVTGDGNLHGDIFIHDQLATTTIRVSVGAADLEADGSSTYASITADGTAVAFSSRATNLVIGDTNGTQDIFVHDRHAGGLSLEILGNCPGSMTLRVRGATFGGPVALVLGAAGSFVKPTPPCAGLTLGVALPARTAIVTADAAGTAVLNFSSLAGACGRSLQGVDVRTCRATNVVIL